MTMTHDELMRKMAEDELQDQMEVASDATPRDYAKARGIAPQKVYYYMRKPAKDPQHLPSHFCNCGRRVINIDEANKLFDGIDERKRKL